MRILLVRHGQSQGNVDHEIRKKMADHAVPLSAAGHAQAREAGTFLRDYYRTLFKHEYDSSKPPHVRMWVSPYLRARQTSDCIQETAGDVITDVREHISLCEQQFGLFHGLTDEELPVLFPEMYRHYQQLIEFGGRFWARMPLGESRFDVANRVHEAFGTFHRDKDQYGIKNIIVVCHGVTLRAFVMRWLHLSPEWFENEPNPHNCSIRLLEDGIDQGYIAGSAG